MSKTFQARRLDVASFADAKATLSGVDPLQKYERLMQEVQAPVPNLTINWRAVGGHRKAINGSVYPSIHLSAEGVLPLTCQRCMGEVTTPVAVDRHLLFVPDEDTAAALDDESEDDVLVSRPDLNLQALIEDEFLMALPLVPRHDVCPDGVKLSAQSADFEVGEDAKPSPFAALAALKGEKKSG